MPGLLKPPTSNREHHLGGRFVGAVQAGYRSVDAAGQLCRFFEQDLATMTVNQRQISQLSKRDGDCFSRAANQFGKVLV